MNQEDIKLRLLAGLPIELESIGYIYPLTLKEIILMGESKFNEMLSCLLLDSNLVKQALQTDEDISSFEAFTLYAYGNETFREMSLKGLEIFFKSSVIYMDGLFHFSEKKVFLSEEIFNQMQTVLRIANKIPETKTPEYNPANERARNFIEKIQASKKKMPKPPSEVNMHSLISGVAWKSPNTTLAQTLDLTIYQLYDAFDRLELIDNCSFTISALYAGTIDGKKIDLKKLNWAKNLNI